MSAGRLVRSDRLRTFLGDLSASLVGFATFFPLCLGLALMAGVPASAGIAGACIGATVVSLLVSVPVQLNAPTTSLLLVSMLLYKKFGAAGLSAATLLTGTLQLLASRLRLGRWFHAIAPSVVEGVLVGTAVTILVKHVASASHLRWTVLLPALITLALWPCRLNPLKAIPGVLVVTVAVSAAVHLAGMDAPVSPPLAFGGPGLDRPGVAFLSEREFYLSVFTMLLISTSKALASASVMGQHAHGGVVDFDRDLRGFGLGNIACGLVGGLPLSANLGGSSVLVQAGARTALANVLQGVWIAAAVAFLPAVLTGIPEEVTFGVTLYSVVKLLSPERIRKLKAVGRAEWHTFGLVAVVASTIGINEAMLAGLGVSIVRLALVFGSSLKIHAEPRDDAARSVHVRLAGPLTVLGLPGLYDTLTGFPRGTTVNVDTTGLSYCDAGCLAKLHEFQHALARTGGELILR